MDLSLKPNPSGMILLNKAPGLTSFKALGAIKKSYQTKKVGHAGTLDQFASGLMIICVGEATRLLSWFTGMDKVYRAVIRFGVETDTLDPEGRIVSEGPVPRIEDIEAKLADFRGIIDQVPPKYSAIHIQGRRAYERTLAGEDFVMPVRQVTIHGLEVDDWAPPLCTIRVACSSGTYIRSLARDIGLALGTCAHLSALCRESVGPFRLDQAIVPGQLPADLVGGRCLAESLGAPAILDLNPGREADFLNGKPIGPDFFVGSSRLPDVSDQAATLPVLAQGLVRGLVRLDGTGTFGYVAVFPQGI